MATWRQLNRLPFILNANKDLLQIKAQTLSFHPALRNQASACGDNRGVEIGVTRDSETIVCFHPAPDIPYELTKPIPRLDPTLDSTETHDLVLKSQLNKEVLNDKKMPAIEELAKMFYTTKHRWYPVGQYHTRRRNRNPPKDR
ncbi:39S ribosomal protein L42, mitochondrial isoform X2 [Tachysurus vachellii]|uniref:39S ribosomal protein L42, mitochondrial isoform X2 n=1 Tax=Tachysurus vachellii TaxID=175792 RepID=UPI00296B22FD|nr:39S ribosomal protein L42, mitochondrial isoform X2 [Tachysurus vachellii]